MWIVKIGGIKFIGRSVFRWRREEKWVVSFYKEEDIDFIGRF